MVRHRIFLLFLILLMGIGVLSAGCGGKTPTVSQGDAGNSYLTVTDDLNRTVTLPKKPEKIVALSPSLLAPLGAVDAKLIGRPASKTGVPEFAKPIEEVGTVNDINIEKVVSLTPDLVIAYQGRHDKFVPIFEGNGIPVIVVHMKTYQDVLDKIVLFAQITGEEKKGAELTSSMREKLQATLDRTPKEKKKVAILHSTAKSVTVELEGSIAGSAAKMLGLINVAGGGKEKELDSAPYSLESLVESDPDIIFITTMGRLDEIKERMTADVESNPAWSSLGAVKRHAVYFLPQELFLLNPGLDYPEAVHTMAKLAYPEAFDDDE